MRAGSGFGVGVDVDAAPAAGAVGHGAHGAVGVRCLEVIAVGAADGGLCQGDRLTAGAAWPFGALLDAGPLAAGALDGLSFRQRRAARGAGKHRRACAHGQKDSSNERHTSSPMPKQRTPHPPDVIGADSGDPLEGIDPQIGIWLMAAKTVLLAEGFKRDLKQFRKPGQTWGLIRQEPDDMQIHVRAFTDGRLESEVELSNKFVQHLWSHRRNAHEEVSESIAVHIPRAGDGVACVVVPALADEAVVRIGHAGAACPAFKTVFDCYGR